MPTAFPDLFNALNGPFDEKEVRVRSQGGRQLSYITARTAMNRLDYVLGPENWWDEYLPGEHSVICKLTVRLPDGATLTKSDAGGYAGMADQGDDDKSGYSDAFKRAAVKFGVGRYLYRDGVPIHRAPSAAPRAALNPPAPASGEAPIPRTGDALIGWAFTLERTKGVKAGTFLLELGRRRGWPEDMADWPADVVAEAVAAMQRQLEKRSAVATA